MWRAMLETVTSNQELIQIVEAAMAEAARLSGAWLVCKPGCAECCMGPFPITQLDAWRLRAGLAQLERRDPERAAMVRRRSRDAVAGMAAMENFPGDLTTGILDEDEEAEERFACLPDEEYCPALDPETLTCDLYDARPITCRIFGPAVRSGGDVLGVCELNYHGATDEQIAACQVQVDPGGLEDRLLEGQRQETMVAFALVKSA
ncbi:MAG: YkgJ family cysteine cluster protein [Candidatus Solibacter sp.]|nr:YkgJ family cysteine cluster protein [Candidatus Solibacter sp.]